MARITVTLDGKLQSSRNAPGRGAWVCSVGCFDLAAGRNAFERALHRPVPNPGFAALRATLFDST
jgi:predicted RNA-binding protein YlxR (DUF448 family)